MILWFCSKLFLTLSYAQYCCRAVCEAEYLHLRGRAHSALVRRGRYRHMTWSYIIAVGRCVKPNICICEDGRIAPSCAEAGSEDQAQDCSGTKESGDDVRSPHSLYVVPHFMWHRILYTVCGSTFILYGFSFISVDSLSLQVDPHSYFCMRIRNLYMWIRIHLCGHPFLYMWICIRFRVLDGSYYYIRISIYLCGGAFI
jgi:hypothetical protein